MREAQICTKKTEPSAKRDGKGKTRQRSALAALGKKRGRNRETGKRKRKGIERIRANKV
jgi:hypothetical protein